ncbi:MAG: ubiquinone biosynthesis protein COQ4 [Saprospiraceae bacterium]|nr:ubiquinone biosynthesis protein COQ4 [Saprospiraceae bacterium]
MKTNLVLNYPLRSLRKWLALGLIKWLQPLYMKLRKKKNAWQCTRQVDLKSYPFFTLGGALYDYLETHGFELITGFEDHDILHVLFAYHPHVLGEIELQCFLIGMGKRTLPTFATVLVGYSLFPEWWLLFKEAYQRGRTCCNCSAWQFEHLLNEPIEHLRAQIFRQPIDSPNPLNF